MPMLCLGGTFRILGTEPDGDSIRFYPDDPATWSDGDGANQGIRFGAAVAAKGQSCRHFQVMEIVLYHAIIMPCNGCGEASVTRGNQRFCNVCHDATTASFGVVEWARCDL